MEIALTEEQRQVVARANGKPVKLVDPVTRVEYVIINAAEFQHALEVAEDERERAELAKIAVHAMSARIEEEDMTEMVKRSMRNSEARMEETLMSPGTRTPSDV